MNVDIAALRAIERDKDIPFDTVIEAIETALLTAYRHTEGHQPHARVDIDRKTGVVRVLAHEPGDDGESGPEWDDTPEGFGRIAATTARQVILQRLRDAENERTFGEFAGQGGRDRRRHRAARRPGERPRGGGGRLGGGRRRPAAGRAGAGGALRPRRAAALLRGPVSRGARAAPQITLSRTHPNLVRKLFALEVPEIADGSVEIVAVAREAGHRTKIAVRSTVPGVNPKGACIGPMGARVRGGDERAGRREDRHHRLVGRPGDVRRQRAVAGEGGLGDGARRARPGRPASIVPDFQLSLAIGKEGQNARLAARLTGWRIDIRSDADPRVTGASPASHAGAPDRRRGRPAADAAAGAARTPVRSPADRRRGTLESVRRPGRSRARRTASRSASADRGRSGPVSGAAPGHRPTICCGSSRWTGCSSPDPRRRLPGRGAWLHPVPECLARAERRSAFPRALRVPGPLDADRVRSHLQQATSQQDRSTTTAGARDLPGPADHESKVDPS